MSHSLTYCFSDFSTLLHLLINSPLLFTAEYDIPLNALPQFVYLLACGWTCELFPVLVTVNKTTINIKVQVSYGHVFKGVELLVYVVSTCLSL